MEAQPSGDITEYTLFSSIRTESATPIPNAPPLPPSPITTETIGTLRLNISDRFFAIASPCPFSSASIPGYAPEVSIIVSIGSSNLSAILINLNAFLYPSGLAIPKFLNILDSKSRPFWCPIIIILYPSTDAKPPIIAWSSLESLSPCSSTKS